MRNASRFAVVLSLALPMAAAAQAANPVGLAITAGAAKPIGDLSNVADIGYTAGARWDLPWVLPFTLQLMGNYSHWSYKSTTGTSTFALAMSSEDLTMVSAPRPAATYASGSNGSTTSWELGVNGISKLATTGTARPYLIAGAAYFRNTADAGSTSVSHNDWGGSAGAGLDLMLSGFTAFGEVRYVNAFLKSGSNRSSYSYVPIVVGVKF